ELIGQDYPRLRFGIGNAFPRGSQVDYVLNAFSDEEQKLLPERIETAVDMIRSFCLAGANVTMNQYNNR
ncbi:MAG: aminoacyl-tRNA hydrolase, partial [Proteiniphilum sp.]